MDYSDIESGKQPVTQETINITAFVPTLPDDEHKYIYRLSRTVRLLAILDLIFGVFMFFFGPIGMYILFRFVCSLAGYIGAKNYDYCLTTIYLTFLILGVILELAFIYIYEQLYHDDKISQNVLLMGIVYQTMFFFLKGYICRFVCIFASKTSHLSQLSKSQLIKYDNQPVEIVYW